MEQQETCRILFIRHKSFSSDLKQAGGPRGKKLYLRVTVPELVMLLSYLSQHNPRPA